ncbi:unnamed protein product [Prorocentrum cordatum]|uniref:Uncharacterized protein n=1 Tax=Prorocentrum cordatum TaxID=2364126 RepID=A0ABN9T4S7_9DINO|nr:unnamed protein product [Polarella glacialis]
MAERPAHAVGGFVWPRTLWDLGTEAESDAGALGAEAADVRPPGEEAEVVEAVGEAVGAMSLQATDFGFDGMEASDSDSEPDDVPGSARATAPRGADAAGGAPASAGAGAGPDECEGGEAADGTQGQTRAGSYADRSQGLTLQQRLANMEFSDDEDDDDDDPLGIKAKE